MGRVFLLESPNALDLLEGVGERSSLEHICKLFGHDVTSFLLRDAGEFHQTLMYLGAIVRHPDPGDDPIFIHISTHGNSDGITVGADDISWKNLANKISHIYQNLDEYKGPVVLIISACGTNDQELTDRVTMEYMRDNIENPPEYIFVFSADTIDWRDAVVTWTIFYRRVSKLDFLSDDRQDIRKIQKLLRRIGRSGFGPLTYFRWEENQYGRYNADR